MDPPLPSQTLGYAIFAPAYGGFGLLVAWAWWRYPPRVEFARICGALPDTRTDDQSVG
jgi:hypothetical protein